MECIDLSPSPIVIRFRISRSDEEWYCVIVAYQKLFETRDDLLVHQEQQRHCLRCYYSDYCSERFKTDSKLQTHIDEYHRLARVAECYKALSQDDEEMTEPGVPASGGELTEPEAAEASTGRSGSVGTLL